jgi:hypothetical protein
MYGRYFAFADQYFLKHSFSRCIQRAGAEALIIGVIVGTTEVVP